MLEQIAKQKSIIWIVIFYERYEIVMVNMHTLLLQFTVMEIIMIDNQK